MLKHAADNAKIQYVIFTVFVISVICGSLFCRFLGADGFTPISEYFSAYIKTDINTDAILKKALISNICAGCVIFAGGLTRAGVLFIPLAAFREGFNAAFCTSCLCRCFSLNGLIIGVLSEVHLLFYIPIIIFSSSFSIKMSQSFKKSQKNFKIFFVIFQLLMITIFCGVAFFQAYVNTIFMKAAISRLSF